MEDEVMPNLEHAQQRRLDRAHWIFVVVSIYGAIAPFADLLRKHAGDLTWPDHARFHVAWAAGLLFALALVTILLARYPLRAGEKWSWYALAIITVFGIGSLVPASIWLRSGPPAHLYVLTGLSLVAMVAALVMAWRPIFRPGNSEVGASMADDA